MHYQPQKNLLQNRIILVTGASDGIGREAALTYSEYGASLILLGRNEEKLKAVAREIENAGGTPTPWYTLDLLTCTPASCQALAQRISTHYPRLDGVLHNAGLLGEVRPMDEQDPEIWQQVMQVNVTRSPDDSGADRPRARHQRQCQWHNPDALADSCL